MFKAFLWNFEISYRRDRMLNNLCPLAVDTLAGPFSHILSEGWPYKLIRDCLSRPLDARVAESMEDVKYFPPPRVGNDRASGTV